jgi:arginyl-tRNA synthetase
MDKSKEYIVKLLKKHTKLNEIKLEIPPDSKLGDYAFACFVLSKQYKKNPNEISKELAEKIKPNKIIKEIKAVGPYLNFFLFKEDLNKEILLKIHKDKDKYGMQAKKNKTIVVEYSSPNTNKPLHLGHVRNICLGNSLSKILEFNGYKVVQTCVNNDRGIHICKSMLSYLKFGKNDTPEKSKLKSDFFVGKYYVMYNDKVKENPELESEAKEMLQKWEQGEKSVKELWTKMNKWAFDGFHETYKKFSVKFNKEYFESELYLHGKDIILNGLKKKIFSKNDDGAILIDLEKKGMDKKILLRSDGTSVYITQDLYLAQKKFDDFKFEKSIYVVASEQNYHFQVLFEILKQLKSKIADKCYHFSYGMVNLTTGKMKSREGNVVDADNLIDDMVDLAKKETKEKNEEINDKELEIRSKKIAMAAIRFHMLKFDSKKDFTFNPKDSISFEGETGPYLQYTYARTNSIFKKYSSKIDSKVDFSLLKEPEEIKIIKQLGQFNDVINDVGEKYKIHLLVRYLLDLAQQFNNFYHNYPVLKAEEEIKKSRLLLCSCVQQVIKNGLSLLGIEIMERM